MSVTLKDLKSALDRAQRDATSLEKVHGELTKKVTSTAAVLEKATATHAAASAEQSAAVVAYAADPDANDARLDKADRAVRKATISLDAATDAHRASTSAVTNVTTNRAAAAKEIERLELELDAHHEVVVDATAKHGDAIVQHAQGLLAELRALLGVYDDAAKARRTYGDAGHGHLQIAHGAHFVQAIIVELARRGADVPMHAFDALIGAVREPSPYGAGCAHDPGVFAGQLFAVLSAPVTPIERGENLGFISRTELRALAKALEGGASWAEAARVAFTSTWHRYHVATAIQARPAPPPPAPLAPEPPTPAELEAENSAQRMKASLGRSSLP